MASLAFESLQSRLWSCWPRCRLWLCGNAFGLRHEQRAKCQCRDADRRHLPEPIEPRVDRPGDENGAAAREQNGIDCHRTAPGERDACEERRERTQADQAEFSCRLDVER